MLEIVLYKALNKKKKRAGRMEKNTCHEMGECFIYTIDTHNGFKVVTGVQP